MYATHVIIYYRVLCNSCYGKQKPCITCASPVPTSQTVSEVPKDLPAPVVPKLALVDSLEKIIDKPERPKDVPALATEVSSVVSTSIYQPRIIPDVDDTPLITVINEDTSAKHTDEVDNTYKINKRHTLPWKQKICGGIAIHGTIDCKPVGSSYTCICKLKIYANYELRMKLALQVSVTKIHLLEQDITNEWNKFTSELFKLNPFDKYTPVNGGAIKIQWTKMVEEFKSLGGIREDFDTHHQTPYNMLMHKLVYEIENHVPERQHKKDTETAKKSTLLTLNNMYAPLAKPPRPPSSFDEIGQPSYDNEDVVEQAYYEDDHDNGETFSELSDSVTTSANSRRHNKPKARKYEQKEEKWKTEVIKAIANDKEQSERRLELEERRLALEEKRNDMMMKAATDG
jgi:hypothetical protein